ncbi:hypothetical protein [Pseudarthrobacter sp. Y6]|uniref:hypothetical protein n=1 Tax=Pseudarthrobacter sp. Y6 TaxID=3418422 RepID=UPI003CEB56B4
MAGHQGADNFAYIADPKLLESVRKRTKVLGNGTSVVESTGWQSLGAWAVDFGLVAVMAAVACISVLGSGAGTAGKALAAAGAVWVVAPGLYGFCCAGGISLGSLATGTRLVRFGTGGRPGFWRAGWVMFARMVLFPVVVLVFLLAAAGGSSPSGDGPRTRHITLDRRFPVPPPPVHPSVVGAAAEDAAARHRQLPGLYDQGGQRG